VDTFKIKRLHVSTANACCLLTVNSWAPKKLTAHDTTQVLYCTESNKTFTTTRQSHHRITRRYSQLLTEEMPWTLHLYYATDIWNVWYTAILSICLKYFCTVLK